MLSGETGLNAGSMGLGPPVVVLSVLVSLLVIFGGVVMARRRPGVAEYLCAFTIVMVSLVPSRTFRYVLPLAPFVLIYFLTGVETLFARLRAGSGAPAFRIAAVSLLCFLTAEHGQYVWQKLRGPVPPWIQDGQDVHAVTDFVSTHVAPGATAASTNPALLYLHTGHQAVAYVEPRANWSRWHADGIEYAVALHLVPKPSRSLGYRVVYESPRLGLWVIQLGASPP